MLEIKKSLRVNGPRHLVVLYNPDAGHNEEHDLLSQISSHFGRVEKFSLEKGYFSVFSRKKRPYRRAP